MEEDKAERPSKDTSSHMHDAGSCYMITIYLYDRPMIASSADRAEAIRRVLENTARELWDQ